MNRVVRIGMDERAIGDKRTGFITIERLHRVWRWEQIGEQENAESQS